LQTRTQGIPNFQANLGTIIEGLNMFFAFIRDHGGSLSLSGRRQMLASPSATSVLLRAAVSKSGLRVELK
jgi:hypothetical protein